MIKSNGVLATFLLFLSINLSAFADDTVTTGTDPNPDNYTGGTPPTDTTSKYLKTLGAFLGYNLDEDSDDIPIVDSLLSYTASIAQQGSAFLQSYLTAIPINSAIQSFTTNTSYDAYVNPFANQFFTSGYAQANGSGVISVTCNFDQQTFQNDPVSQSALNLLMTPDWSICPATTGSSTSSSSSSSSSSSQSSSCQASDCMSSDQVMATVLLATNDGVIPSENDYYTFATNSASLSQLNSDNLIGPLVYSVNNTGQQAPGLPNLNQAQLAQEFIRYVTEAVAPIPTMNKTDYSDLYTIANTPTTDQSGNPITTVDTTNVMNAKVALQNYLLSLRVFAARNAVVNNNLYYMLSRRIPQTTTNSSGQPTSTSEALNEFQMATWRLYNPTQSDQWVNQINQASPSTIQKEMAVLLSEINFQLYKNRVLEERLLLTDSIILLSFLSLSKPNANFPNNVQRDTSTSQ